MNKNIWFKRKIYGWGWYPYTWQAWTILAIYLITIIFLVNNFKNENQIYFYTIFAILTIVLILISYLKGEKPKWSWGN